MVGNVSNYDEQDVIRVFLRIDSKLSRNDLSRKVVLGEGSVKSILKMLKNRGLLYSTRKGHFLTNNGKCIRGKIYSIISEIKPVQLKLFRDHYGAAILVRNPGRKITYRERDIAIRTGAEAALLFRFEKRLFLPQCEQDIIDTSELDDLFDYTNGDILVVVFSDKRTVAEKALLNVASALNKCLADAFKLITY